MTGTQLGEARIAKTDTERRIVFGWANVAIDKTGDQLVDSHGDGIDWEELESAAYDFNLTFRATGNNHEGTAKGRLIESFMVTPEKLEAMSLAKGALPLGWWVGFKIDDEATWNEVKKGTYRMFSIQGVAIREEDVQ
jgi:hypothetical protein